MKDLAGINQRFMALRMFWMNGPASRGCLRSLMIGRGGISAVSQARAWRARCFGAAWRNSTSRRSTRRDAFGVLGWTKEGGRERSDPAARPGTAGGAGHPGRSGIAAALDL